MRKLILFCIIVLLPAVVVGISNFHVFPDSSWAATIMLGLTVGAAALFTWQSSDATAKIARYCIIADFVVAAILCANLAAHWILAREVSAAKQGVVERHAEEDRDDRRAAERADRELALRDAEARVAAENAKLQREERRRLAQLPISERRSMMSAPKPEPAKTSTVQPMTLVASGAVASVSIPAIMPTLTPEQVRESWWWTLTALAIAEVAASVLAGAILGGIWEWDRNKDGIPDHLQRPVEVANSPGK
jgi:hypothetical protein